MRVLDSGESGSASGGFRDEEDDVKLPHSIRDSSRANPSLRIDTGHP